MRKKLFCLLIAIAAIVGTTAVLTSTPAEAKNCPRGTHRVNCPRSSFCCPDFAICDCLP